MGVLVGDGEDVGVSDGVGLDVAVGVAVWVAVGGCVGGTNTVGSGGEFFPWQAVMVSTRPASTTPRRIVFGVLIMPTILHRGAEISYTPGVLNRRAVNDPAISRKGHQWPWTTILLTDVNDARRLAHPWPLSITWVEGKGGQGVEMG